jgi:hypothetical protein
MSSDEGSVPAPPPGEPQRETTGAASGRLSLSRRELVKLAGAGVALASLPELAGCSFESAPAPDDVHLLDTASWVGVGRRDDLVVLSLGLIGLEVRDATRTAPPAGLTLKGNLYLGRTSGPAYLLVDHPPQHLLEEAFLEPPANGTPPPGTAPSTGEVVQARIARKSRLSFFVPDAILAIPYELDAVLATLSTLQLHVAPNAWDEPPGVDVLYIPAFEHPAPPSATPPPVGGRIKLALRAARARQRRLAYRVTNPEASVRPAATSGAAAQADTKPLLVRFGPALPTAPGGLQTQIELPFRLVISPNAHALWQHAASPVVSAAGRVELWHTRLTTPEGWQKTIRALHTRDGGFNPGDSTALQPGGPFRASLAPKDRADLVHLTTNYTLRDSGGATLAHAVDVDALMLSALGGWLDSRGAWNQAKGGGLLLAWDHRATMGRDQYVRVVHAGYLYPFGHLAVKVTITERKLLPGYDDAAYLWQRDFLVVKEPLKTYDGLAPALVRGFPFTSLRFKTLVTPNLAAPTALGTVSDMPTSSWVVGLDSGAPVPFEVEAFDHDGNAHTFTTACIWLADGEVTAHFATDAAAIAAEWAGADSGQRRTSLMKSQRVALAPSDDLDDTTHTARSMAHKAAVVADVVPFTPQLDVAELAVDAVRVLTGADVGTSFSYVQAYLDRGFDAAGAATPQNLGGVFMALANPLDTSTQLLLSQKSDRSGGFASPDMVISGLARAQGLVAGDPGALLGGNFDPLAFFGEGGAKLFGVLALKDLVDAVVGPDALKQAPRFLTQALDAAELVFHLFQDASGFVDDLKNRILAEMKTVLAALPPGPGPGALSPFEQQLYARVASAAAAVGLDATQLQDEATTLGNALDALLTAAGALATDLEKVATVDASTDLTALTDAIVADVSKARDALSALGGTLKSLVLPIDEGVKTQLLNLYDKVVVQLLPPAGSLEVFRAAVLGFVSAEEAIKDQHVKLDWGPTISGWPKGNELFWPNDPNGLKIGVEIRGKADGDEKAGATIFASLTDFELRLLGTDAFIKLAFDKLVFKTGTDGKATVDVGFRGVHFGGPLSFIETIRNLIPLDGFSDPPALQVSPSGITASYTLPLPNVAIGVFSLENLSISAGFDIPFIGKSLTVSFGFCSRDAPFVLTVCMLGGGGFVGLTIAPDGVRLLEIALEAQACLAVDLGVASGSVSIALGIYYAIESGDCTLSGYFRLRGVVQVLGIISASIELKLELTYESATGKVVGRASLEIEVSVLCFSTSVTIETERKFSGGNSDPTFRQVMAYDPATSYAPWDDYCGAFTLVPA